MIKRNFIILIFFFAAFIGIARQGLCQESTNRERIISRFNRKVPGEWGERVSGVRNRLNTDQKLIALTFDACGGPRIIGAINVMGRVDPDNYIALIIGFLAVILGTLNVVGGFMVTDRMLEMFKKKK